MSARYNGAPQTVVEALAYQLRAGFSALHDPSAQRRLFELSKSQLKEMAERLTKERWALDGTRRVPPWAPNEIKTLIRIWRKGHA